MFLEAGFLKKKSSLEAVFSFDQADVPYYAARKICDTIRAWADEYKDGRLSHFGLLAHKNMVHCSD